MGHYIGAWDSGIQYGCKCDVGFRGESCAMKECPSTADPQGYYGNDDGEDCSGRGLCDYSSGECACFSGYTGKDCGTIEALACPPCSACFASLPPRWPPIRA